MAKFIIKGGNTIGGTFRPRGNKNAVLPMLAACVLTDQPVVLHNVPLIKDVKVMLELLATLGVEISVDDHTVSLCAKTYTPPSSTVAFAIKYGPPSCSPGRLLPATAVPRSIRRAATLLVAADWTPISMASALSAQKSPPTKPSSLRPSR